jgi:ribosome biogenesis protein ERB1
MPVAEVLPAISNLQPTEDAMPVCNAMYFPPSIVLGDLGLSVLRFAGPVRSVSAHPSGQWLATGAEDGTVRLWEVSSGRCCRHWSLGSSSSSSGKQQQPEPVQCVAWCPDPSLQLLGAAVGRRVVLLVSGLGGEDVDAAA